MSRMKIGEVRKLHKMLPGMLRGLGFKLTEVRIDSDTWMVDTAHGCPLRVTPYLQLAHSKTSGHPWLACCFMRPIGEGYADLHSRYNANRFTGKCNCHIFDDLSALEALAIFEGHLRWIIGPVAAKPLGTLIDQTA